ncbi:hypothetical protein E2C01_048360 [Portunus trituberculatus]|uniref:Uncharacterized protein n=1 Tax=Portunus trituberculatus TaxID=210409 RepID=A0A5B7GD55_PORTR|nr:hypothetical protein [Portunus trituberculatus]
MLGANRVMGDALLPMEPNISYTNYKKQMEEGLGKAEKEKEKLKDLRISKDVTLVKAGWETKKGHGERDPDEG